MLRIRTLGGLSLHPDGGRAPAAPATQPRRLAVLALVARSGARGVTRERMLALLWPDGGDDAARKALSQALYALRAGLDVESLFLGTQELRLDPAAATCDATEFEAAIAEGALERAATLYEGPFLDGFRLPGAPEFDRWVEEERAALARRHADVVERLARRALARGDAVAAAGWWRRRAAADPLDPRVALGLMEALAAAGDRVGAIRHAEIHETLVSQELGIAPDRAVTALATALREAPAPLPTPTPPATPAAPAAALAPAVAPAVAPPPPPRPRRRLLAGVLGALAVAATTAAVWVAGARSTGGRGDPAHAGDPGRPADAVLAVGRIDDYRDGHAGPAGPVIDMLATDLARVPGLQVISNARMMELASQLGGSGRQVTTAAAEASGATELLEGALQQRPDGVLQLDLRRVAVDGGQIRAAYRLTGRDVFALVREATDSLAGPRRAAAAGDSGAPTDSPAAYARYEEGLRAYAVGNYAEALRRFGDAVAADSNFALATYYLVRASAMLEAPLPPGLVERMGTRPVRGGARERLLLRSAWALATHQPPSVTLPVADSLATLFPTDVDGPYVRALINMSDARFVAAMPDLRRVIRMDSLALRGTAPRCRACEALGLLTTAYVALDSLGQAETLARDWVRRQPRSAVARSALWEVLMSADRHDEALVTFREAVAIAPRNGYDLIIPGVLRVRAGDPEAGEAAARAILRAPRDAVAEDVGASLLVVALRHQGRWREAVEFTRARRARRVRAGERPPPSYLLGVTLLERGRPAEAWDALLASQAERTRPTEERFVIPWALAAGAAAELHDRQRAELAADSADETATRLGTFVAASVALHARGMAHLARGDSTAAIEALERAVYAPTIGFTRTNYELARLYLARHRPADALRMVGAGLHGTLGGPNSFVTLTELHVLAAKAHEALGRPDSAAVHWRWTAGALRRPDPEGIPTRDLARQRLAALAR